MNFYPKCLRELRSILCRLKLYKGFQKIKVSVGNTVLSMTLQTLKRATAPRKRFVSFCANLSSFRTNPFVSCKKLIKTCRLFKPVQKDIVENSRNYFKICLCRTFDSENLQTSKTTVILNNQAEQKFIYIYS